MRSMPSKAETGPPVRSRGGKPASRKQKQMIFALCQELGRDVPDVKTAAAAHATINNLKRILETRRRGTA